jgi:hypothetical protein
MAVDPQRADRILDAAIRAPSADNRHLFELELAGDEIRMWAKPEFVEAPFHRRVLCLIGFGAAAENMIVRAAALGLSGGLAWWPEPSLPGLILRLPLAASSQVASALDAAIDARHTNRRVRYHGPGLTSEQQTTLTRLVEPLGVRLVPLDARDRRKAALDLLRCAEAERFRNPALHGDLFGSIRFEAGWNAPCPEGLAPGTLEVEPPMRPMFAALRHWKVMRAANFLGAPASLALRAADLPCRLAPNLCALATQLPLEQGAVAAGRALERAWLQATAWGLAFQPFAAPALLALDGYREVSAPVRQRLQRGWAGLTPGETPVIVFRMGHARAPAMRSGRPPSSSLVRNARPA